MPLVESLCTAVPWETNVSLNNPTKKIWYPTVYMHISWQGQETTCPKIPAFYDNIAAIHDLLMEQSYTEPIMALMVQSAKTLQQIIPHTLPKTVATTIFVGILIATVTATWRPILSRHPSQEDGRTVLFVLLTKKLLLP